MAAPHASGSIDIAGAPERVYALLTDLEEFTEVVAETERMRVRSGRFGQVGAVFAGTNSNGKRRWTTTCRVTDAEAGTRFAFDVSHTGIPVSRWQYEIAPVDGGCRVTETMWD